MVMPPARTLQMMAGLAPAGVAAQLSGALEVIERHLASTLLAVHVHGSTVDGGLKPRSDLDLMVTVSAGIGDAVRRVLMLDLLGVSAPPGTRKDLRALEVTVVVRGDVVPWRYPATRELQFGEWLRDDLLAGTFEPAVVDPDLALLLTQVRRRGIALVGPAAAELFDAIPERDVFRAMADTLAQWRSPQDWAGDEQTVVLALARIRYSAETGGIAPKDIAAEWVVPRVPERHRAILAEARQAYLGQCADRLARHGTRLDDLIASMRDDAAALIAGRP